MKDRDLIREANYVIKNFVLLWYLRRHAKELSVRARISMEFVAAKDRFRALRMKAYLKEPSADVLATQFHKDVQKSVTTMNHGLDLMRNLQKNNMRVLKNQDIFLNTAKKSLRLSNCLCNLSQLMTEFGPQQTIHKMTDLEGERILGVHELKEKVFIHKAAKSQVEKPVKQQ